jgi:hypothetical protein
MERVIRIWQMEMHIQWNWSWTYIISQTDLVLAGVRDVRLHDNAFALIEELDNLKVETNA